MTYNTYPVTHVHHASNVPQVIYVAKTLEEYEQIRKRYELPTSVAVIILLFLGYVLWKSFFGRPY